MSETPRFKHWEELDITDDFIFTRVMRNKRLCRTLLEMILKVKIGEIHFLTSHHSLQIDPNAKGIIMDVYLRDENKVINVEMQTGRKKELPKRSRYYQSVADVSTTSTGAKYRNLPDNILIFICCFDPFNRGRPIYRFQNICLDDEPIFLNDGTQKLFLNTTCKDTGSLDGELRLFYDYVRERTARTAFTKELDNSISKLKQNQEERRMSLLYASRMMESHQDGYAVGLERGLASGREEGISIGLERGRATGREEGAYQTKLETARAFLLEGLAPVMVARCTALPLETVLELAQKR